jgi:NitT/TauT family transport system substrate-binding protein
MRDRIALGLALVLLGVHAGQAEEKRPKEPLRVKASMPGVGGSLIPVELGIQKGIYREEGLDLILVLVRGNVAIAALVTGDLDYIIGTGGSVRAATKGMPIRVIMAIDTRPVWFLMTRPEIKSISELKGKRIGVGSMKGGIQLAAEMALKQGGIPSKEVAWSPIGATPERLQAMASGAIDAAVIALPGNMNGRKMGYRELMDVGTVATVPVAALVTTEKKLTEEPAEVKRMIRATMKSVRYFLAHKSEAIEFLAKRFQLPLEQAAVAYDQQAPALTPDGEITEKGFLLDLEFAREAGEVIGTVPLSRILDTKLLQEAQRELGRFRP